MILHSGNLAEFREAVESLVVSFAVRQICYPGFVRGLIRAGPDGAHYCLALGDAGTSIEGSGDRGSVGYGNGSRSV